MDGGKHSTAGLQRVVSRRYHQCAIFRKLEDHLGRSRIRSNVGKQYMRVVYTACFEFRPELVRVCNQGVGNWPSRNAAAILTRKRSVRVSDGSKANSEDG